MKTTTSILLAIALIIQGLTLINIGMQIHRLRGEVKCLVMSERLKTEMVYVGDGLCGKVDL